MDGVQYGIAIANKYDLFFDEDTDPLELISAQKGGAATKEEKAAKKKEKKQLKSAKEAAPVAPATTVPAKAAKLPAKPEGKDGPDEKENKPNANAPRRGGRPQGGEQRAPRPPRPDGEGPKRGGFGGQYQDEVPPRFAGNQEDRGNFGDRFGERGPPGERGRGRGRGGPRGRGRGEGRGGRGGFGGENRGGFGGTEAPEGGGDIFQQADDNSWNANSGETQPRGGFASGAQANVERGGFGQSDGGGRGGFGTFGDEETERLSGARPPNRGGFGNRGGRGRGFGGPRGEFGRGRGGRGGRQFDRHSGSDTTGIKPVEKREGGGQHNWGTINDELAGETEPLNTTVGSDEVPAGENGERGEGREGETEPQGDAVQEFTLDEWKALQLQKEKDSAKPQFNIRKPGDGEDPTLWKKLIPLAREKEPKAKKTAQEEVVDEEEDEESHPKKQLLNIEINFIDTQSHGGRGNIRGGPRGFGRGGGRGEGRGAPMTRRDRGGPGVGRGGGGRASGGRRGENFKMDEESFPELSSAAGPTA